MTLLSKNAEAGFTLVELLMVVALTSVLAVATLDLVTDTMNESYFNATLLEMHQIQNAMMGDPTILENNVRTSFGFLGDVGALPTAAQGILALISQPTVALPAYAVNTAARIGVGWNGPYLGGGNSGTTYTTDGWGNPFIYNATANPPTLVSLGSDGVVGGSGFAQDLTMTMSTSLLTATVQGFVCSRGGPFTSAAQVELNYPVAGVLTQAEQTLVAANAGQFTFANVPLGVRSISVYIPSKISPTTTLGPVVFTVDKPNTLVPCNAIDVNP